MASGSKTDTATGEAGIETLTPHQRQIIDLVLGGQNTFMTGCAGTGKSHVLKIAVAQARAHGINTVVTASTGVAADILGGTTLHSQLGLGLAQDPLPVLLRKARASGKIKQKWKNVQLLVIDEVSMLHPDFFETVDQVLRGLKHAHLPFGGISLLLSGDFFQLPPVLDRNRADTLPVFAFQTNAWRRADIQVVELVDIFRQAADPTFAQLLSRVRRAEHTLDDIVMLAGRVNAEIQLPEGIEPTRMYSRKVCVDTINTKKLSELVATESHVFNSAAFIEIDTDLPAAKRMRTDPTITRMTRAQKQVILEAARTQVVKNAAVPQELALKVGAQVMLMVNLDLENGLVNGSRGVIVDFRVPTTGGRPLPIVKFANREMQVNTYVWNHEIPGVGVVGYRQMPLRLAWAITIHKAQGLSLDYVYMKLDRSVFEHAQAYVALSRVRTLEGLSLEGFTPDVIRAHPAAVIFYQALQHAQHLEAEAAQAAMEAEAEANTRVVLLCETVEEATD